MNATSTSELYESLFQEGQANSLASIIRAPFEGIDNQTITRNTNTQGSTDILDKIMKAIASKTANLESYVVESISQKTGLPASAVRSQRVSASDTPTLINIALDLHNKHAGDNDIQRKLAPAEAALIKTTREDAIALSAMTRSLDYYFPKEKVPDKAIKIVIEAFMSDKSGSLQSIHDKLKSTPESKDQATVSMSF